MLTESPDTNIPDVFRDLGAVGLPEGRQAGVLATTQPFDWSNVNEAGDPEEQEMVPLGPVARRQLMEAAWAGREDVWPDGIDYLATTYSVLSSNMEMPGPAPDDAEEINEASRPPAYKKRVNRKPEECRSGQSAERGRRRWSGRSAWWNNASVKAAR